MSGDDNKRDSKNGDDAAETDDAQSVDDNASSDSSDKDADSGDVGGGKDRDNTSGKSGRAGERISDLVNDNKKLKQDNEDLATRMEALEAAIAAGGTKDETKKSAASDDNPAIKKLKALGYNDEQIEAAKLVYQSVAGQTDSELKKEVKALQDELAANKEKAALNQAIEDAKQDGIEVTQKQIAEFRRDCLKSSDPREQLLAEAPYPRIIKMMLMDGIVQKAAKEDANDEGEDAGSKAPKIPAGKDSRQEKKPESKGTKYDPGNPQGSMDAIERRVLARVGIDDDE